MKTWYLTVYDAINIPAPMKNVPSAETSAQK